MNLVPVAVGRQLARSALLVQKSSPELLFGAGIVGMVGSTVLACRATLKMESVLDDAQKNIKKTDVVIVDHPMDYSEKDRRKDVTVIRVQTGIRIVRLYAPAIIVGGISIAALTRSHGILKSRNVALTAAYGALDKGFREYRSRVVDKYGEEEDRNFRYGTRQEVILDDEGKEKMVTRVQVDDKPSIYARMFDQRSPSWQPDHEYNWFFLRCQQNFLNDRLHAIGHVMLNEAYDLLQLPRSKEGNIVGWVRAKDGGAGDNYIDFGIFDGENQVSNDFVNGYDGSILLDFNVDGVIWDKI